MSIDLRSDLEKQWYINNKTEHVHCPLGCEHPQEKLLADGRMVCGRCLILDNVITEVQPCIPGVCDD